MAFLGGQFKSATHGQFKSAQGGQFDRLLHLDQPIGWINWAWMRWVDVYDIDGDCNLDIPEYDITFEFWFKFSNGKNSTIISAYGMNNSHINLRYK